MHILITNNPLIQERASATTIIEYDNITYMNVLYRAREYIHIGHKLLTHPLSGSIKPNETPYKSIIISSEPTGLDLDSLNIIEESIICARKFGPCGNMPEHVRKDFMLIDSKLIGHI